MVYTIIISVTVMSNPDRISRLRKSISNMLSETVSVLWQVACRLQSEDSYSYSSLILTTVRKIMSTMVNYVHQ